MQSAAEMIRSVREAAGLTRAELARRARTSRTAISRYEAGRSDPTTAVFRRILHAAGADIVLVRLARPNVRRSRGVREPSRPSVLPDPEQSNRLRGVLRSAATVKRSRDPAGVTPVRPGRPWPVFRDLAARHA